MCLSFLLLSNNSAGIREFSSLRKSIENSDSGRCTLLESGISPRRIFQDASTSANRVFQTAATAPKNIFCRKRQVADLVLDWFDEGALRNPKKIAQTRDVSKVKRLIDEVNED